MSETYSELLRSRMDLHTLRGGNSISKLGAE